MFKLSEIPNNIFVIEITKPRKATDETKFLTFLNEVFKNKIFGILLLVEGEKSFSLETKKELNIWFKNNKLNLKVQCVGVGRIKTNNHDYTKVKTKAFKMAMPCPYDIFGNISEGLDWFRSLPPLTVKID